MKSQWLLFCLLILAAGCQKDLIYVHQETGAIDLSISGDGTEHFLFGYQGDTVAFVPRFQPASHKSETANGGATTKPSEEAMTLVSFGHTEAQGLDSILFSHWVATGAAARKAVNDPDELAQMHKAVFGDTSK